MFFTRIYLIFHKYYIGCIKHIRSLFNHQKERCVLKKIFISVLAAVFITIIIPLVIVEVFTPSENAASSEGDMPAVTAEVE